MDPSPSKSIYNIPRIAAPNPSPAHGGTTQTLRAVIIPSPSTSFPANTATINTNTRMHGTPIDRSRPVQTLKRKPSNPNPQASTKKSRNLAIADGEVPTAHKHVPTTASKQVNSKDLPVDYRLLLLSLADQYIAGARGLGSLIAANGLSATHVEQRCKLVATGLGCLETVLKEKVRWISQDLYPCETHGCAASLETSTAPRGCCHAEILLLAIRGD